MSINDQDQSLKAVPSIKTNDTKPDVPDETLDPTASKEIELNAISDALDLDIKDTNYIDEIGWLLDYAKDQAEDNSVEGLKWAIRELETRIGTPPFLEDRIKFMARYAYLFMESKKTNKELKKMTRGVDVI